MNRYKPKERNRRSKKTLLKKHSRRRNVQVKIKNANVKIESKQTGKNVKFWISSDNENFDSFAFNLESKKILLPDSSVLGKVTIPNSQNKPAQLKESKSSK